MSEKIQSTASIFIPLRQNKLTHPRCHGGHLGSLDFYSSFVVTKCLLSLLPGWYLLLLSHFSRVRLCATPWTATHQAPLSLGFSRQEHWSGLPFPSPMHESEKWKWSCSVVATPWTEAYQAPCPWDFPGKSTRMSCHCLLQPGWYQRRSNGESEFSLFLTVARASLSHDVSGWPMGGDNEAALTLLRDTSRGLLRSHKFLCHPVVTRKCPGRYK